MSEPGACATESLLAVSFGEVEAISRKAARGAGMPWGLAEEAGVSVRAVTAWRLPGLDALAALLTRIDRRTADYQPHGGHHEFATPAGLLCPIATGACLSDWPDRLVSREAIVLPPVLSPLLLCPFLATLADDGATRLEWEGGTLVCGNAGPCGPTPDAFVVDASPLRLARTAAPARAKRRAPPLGYQVRMSVWRALEGFAARTYVPASESSRASGAGAGTIDND